MVTSVTHRHWMCWCVGDFSKCSPRRNDAAWCCAVDQARIKHCASWEPLGRHALCRSQVLDAQARKQLPHTLRWYQTPGYSFLTGTCNGTCLLQCFRPAVMFAGAGCRSPEAAAAHAAVVSDRRLAAALRRRCRPSEACRQGVTFGFAQYIWTLENSELTDPSNHPTSLQCPAA